MADEETVVSTGEENNSETVENKEDLATDTSTETKKPEDEGTSEEKSQDDGKGEGAEEQKEDNLKIDPPEDVELDPEGLEDFKGKAKELGIDSKQAQELVNYYAKMHKDSEQARYDAWSEVNEKWVEEAKEDKEIGGDKFDKNVNLAKAAIKKFGTSEFNQALNMTGMGNNPEMIRFLVRVAKGFGEDSLESGKTNSQKPKDPASILFPEQSN